MTNKTITDLTAASALDGSELVPIVQGGNSRKITPMQIATFSDGAFALNNGAVGDGTTDDTAALQAALDAAGDDSVVRLSPGATYLISGPLTTSARQKISGNRATIKRRDQVVTTTTTAITADTTTDVTLTDATGLAVGMTVAFAQQGVARADVVYGATLSAVRTITAVDGNTITLNSAPDVDVSVGGTCFLTFQSLVLADGASVDDVTFDGNRANWTYARWEVTSEIGTTNDDGNRITNCRFVNAPGEGILGYSDDLKVLSCYFDTLGGNGVHLSSVTSSNIIGNRATNGNIDIDVGHADGFVSLSNGNSHVVVALNIADRWISGVGAINNTDSDVSVVDNDFFDMYCAGVEGGAGATRLTVSGNRMRNIGTDDSKKSSLSYYGGLVFIGLSGETYTFTDNTVDDVPSGAIGMIVSGNGGRDYSISGTFNGVVRITQIEDFNLDATVNDGTLRFSGKRGKGRANVTAPAATIGVMFSDTYDYEDLELEVNVTGGSYGIDLSSSATAYRNVNISGTLSGQTTRGVNAVGTAPTIEGLSISGVKIRTTSDAASAFLGIVCYWDGVTINNCKLFDYETAASRIGIITSGQSSAGSMVIKDNEVRGNWDKSILPAENSGLYEINNVLDVASSNTTGNNISGETVI